MRKKAIQHKLPILTFLLGLSLAINVFAFAGIGDIVMCVMPKNIIK